jgi:hypothetical protein
MAEMDGLCGIIEEILEEDGKGVTNRFGRRNQRSKMLIYLCERNGLITNTWCMNPKRRLCIRKAPGD